MSKLFVKKLSPHATIPERASSASTGYDLSSAKEMVVPACGKALIPFQRVRCWGRSNCCRLPGQRWSGFVQSCTRGFHVAVGDRLAQSILERIHIPGIK